jgi:hypothetical protein
MATWDTKEYGFGSGLNSPDYSGAFSSKKDGAFSNAWKTGFGVSGAKSQNNWGEIFGGLFDKAKETNKYRDEAKRPSFGESNRGSGGQLLENLSALYPQQHAPMFIPGETSQGIGGAIGGAIGTIGGALIGGPAGAKIGGSIGGGIGSFF